MKSNPKVLITLFFIFSVGFLSSMPFLNAESGVIVLKSGEEVQGTVIKKTEDSIEVKVRREVKTYKLEDVLEIRGNRPKSLVTSEPMINLSEGMRVASEGSFLYAENIFIELVNRNSSDYNAKQALNIIEDLRKGKISDSYAKNLFKGAYYFSLGEYQKSIDSYEKILEIDPNSSEVYYNLGSAYQALGGFNEAIIYFKKLSRLYSQDIEIYFKLGVCYYGLNKHKQAINYFEKVIDITPEDPESLTLLGISYYSIGKHNKGKDIITQAKDLYEEYGDNKKAAELGTLLDDI